MYGDQTVDLPNLESLADDSIIYDNMHATTPVCAPARSAIITGMYPTTLGTHNMRTYNEGRDTNQPSLGIPSYSPKFPNYISSDYENQFYAQKKYYDKVPVEVIWWTVLNNGDLKGPERE